MSRFFTSHVRALLSAAFLLVGGWLAASPAAQAQPAPSGAAPPDAALTIAPEVRTGTLDNGLRYYIRPNDRPDNRAILRLVVNVGSIVERPDEQGLAHFVEHMLFNGTEQFEEQELFAFLESTGMEFGADVNASTSFDETIYKLQVPTDSAQIVETSFDVLKEWAVNATIAPEEVEKERGVIIEEWRRDEQSAQGRMQKEIRPKVLYNSRHADRLPIGDTSVVNNAPAERLQAFYERWYRPDLMAVVVVGDLDPDRVEQEIRERFAGLETPADPVERPTYDLPAHEETQFAIATDPEFPLSATSAIYKTDSSVRDSVADVRRSLVDRMFLNTLSERLAEKSRTGAATFLRAGASSGSLTRTTKIYNLGGQVPDDSVAAGLEDILVEAERMRQHGITEAELVRRKREVEQAYEQAYADRENQNSTSLAQAYVQQFLGGDVAAGIEAEYALVQDLLPQITAQEVSARASEVFQPTNRVVAVQMPEKEGLTPPTEDELAAVLDRVRQMEVDPYEEEVTDLPLVSEMPNPAEVTNTRTIDTLRVTEWTLANGVRVVFKPTDFEEDEVQFTASSPGGLSLVDDSTYAWARHAASVVGRSGVGAFTQTALEKKLSGESVSVSPYIGGREEGFRGNAAPEDLETMFQLIHLYATAPRADANALDAHQKQQRAFLQNRANAPGAVFQDSLIAALYNNDSRVRASSIDEINALDTEELLGFYRERFADASDFTFTFVGNTTADSVRTLAQRYLGSLPAADRDDTVRDVEPDLPNRPVTKAVRAGMGQRAIVRVLYHGPFTYERTNRHALRSLRDVLRIELRKELRENRSGVYNVSVNTNTQSPPGSEYLVAINFICEPERADELIAAARAEIDSVRTGPVSAETVQSVKAQQRRGRETSLENNGFWVNTLDFTFTTEGEDPLQVLQYDALVESVTPQSVSEAATTYLNDTRYVEGILYPEGFGEAQSDAGEAEGER